jgi:hypothetical protein
MIELLFPCGFDTLEYSWVKGTIGICKFADYYIAKERQQHHTNKVDVERGGVIPRSKELNQSSHMYAQEVTSHVQ